MTASTRSSRRHRGITVLFATLAWLAAASPALGHDRGTSYSAWSIRGDDVHVSVRLGELDLSRFPWGIQADAARDAELQVYLPKQLRIERGGRACTVAEAPRGLRAAPGSVSYEWALRCPTSGAYEIRSDLLLDVSPAHLHFARVKLRDAPTMERVLSSRGSSWSFGGTDDGADEAGTDFAGYLLLGVEHILTGYDHLAFVFVLLLAGRSLWEVAKIVTGFTIAHSLTLGLMVLGYVRPEPGPIEALIGLSIAIVAAENLWQSGGRVGWVPSSSVALLAAMGVLALAGWGNISALTLGGLTLFTFCYFRLFSAVSQPDSLRWGVAFLFGLIHGFGFAAMLTEAGLPAERIVAALFGFNLGVEVGQLAAVAVVWPMLAVLRRRSGRWHGNIVEGGSAAVLALGIYWLISRTYAG